MPITINGSTGIAGVDGSASTPAIQGTDTNTGVTFPAADTVAVSTGGTERMRVDSSGNVGIGTSSPSTYGKLAVTTPTAGYGVLSVSNSAGGGGGGQLSYYYGTAKVAYVDSAVSNGTPGSETASLAFATINSGTIAERARITSGGDFQFNSGYGSVATAYGCRAWVNFNGSGTVAIRADGGISSITDNNVGDYTVNFDVAMPDANYSVAGTAEGLGMTLSSDATTYTSSAARVLVCRNTTAFDRTIISVQIFR